MMEKSRALRVLVVDDERLIRWAIAETLEHARPTRALDAPLLRLPYLRRVHVRHERDPVPSRQWLTGSVEEIVVLPDEREVELAPLRELPDIAVLARIEAPSTAEVTALMCSGDPLVCAMALPKESARPSPTVRTAAASCAGRSMRSDVAGNRRQAVSCRVRSHL